MKTATLILGNLKVAELAASLTNVVVGKQKDSVPQHVIKVTIYINM